jgi:hypothetical protein
VGMQVGIAIIENMVEIPPKIKNIQQWIFVQKQNHIAIYVISVLKTYLQFTSVSISD